jgi:hypothetical protein
VAGLPCANAQGAAEITKSAINAAMDMRAIGLVSIIG